MPNKFHSNAPLEKAKNSTEGFKITFKNTKRSEALASEILLNLRRRQNSISNINHAVEVNLTTQPKTLPLCHSSSVPSIKKPKKVISTNYSIIDIKNTQLKLSNLRQNKSRSQSLSSRSKTKDFSDYCKNKRASAFFPNNLISKVKEFYNTTEAAKKNIHNSAGMLKEVSENGDIMIRNIDSRKNSGNDEEEGYEIGNAGDLVSNTGVSTAKTLESTAVFGNTTKRDSKIKRFNKGLMIQKECGEYIMRGKNKKQTNTKTVKITIIPSRHKNIQSNNNFQAQDPPPCFKTVCDQQSNHSFISHSSKKKNRQRDLQIMYDYIDKNLK